MSKVLIIGDTHLPFVHVNYLKFLKKVKDEKQPDVVVHIGDFFDQYTLSRYEKDPEAMNVVGEFSAAIKEAKRFYSVFPNAIWIIGNHDNRIYKKALSAGIPKGYMKNLAEIYQLPQGWDVQPEVIIDNVRYIHGEAAGGMSSWQNACLKTSQNIVFGHYHSIGGVRYHQGFNGINFSLAVGCGVDDSALAFDYGKQSFNRSVLGCGFVEDGKKAEFIPMDLTQKAFNRKERKIM